MLNLIDFIIFKLDIFLDILLDTLHSRLHGGFLCFQIRKQIIYNIYDYMIVYRCKIKIPFQTPCTCTRRYIHTDAYTPSNRLWSSPCKRMCNISNNISNNISKLIPSNKKINRLLKNNSS